MIYEGFMFRKCNQKSCNNIFLSEIKQLKDESGRYYVGCYCEEHNMNKLLNDFIIDILEVKKVFA